MDGICGTVVGIVPPGECDGEGMHERVMTCPVKTQETEFFALTNSGGWLQPYGKFFMVSLPPRVDDSIGFFLDH